MRTPYQIYKEAIPDGTVSTFNGLSPEEAMLYRLTAAEESIEEHVTYLHEHPESMATYAVSAIRSAVSYISVVASFIPVMARSEHRMSVQMDLVEEVMRALSLDTTAVVCLKEQLRREGSASLSLNELTSLEAELVREEQRLKAQLKQAGKRVETLKLPPIKKTITATAASSTSNIVEGNEEIIVEGSSSEAIVVPGSTPPLPKEKRGKAKRPISVDVENEPLAQVMCVEDDEAQTAGGAAKKRGKGKGPAAGVSATSKSGATATLENFGRLRQMTTQEKKISAALRQLIQLLSHVFATKCLELIPVFDFLDVKVSALEKQVAVMKTQQAESKKAEVDGVKRPMVDVELSAVREAIANASQLFRDDEEYRLEFDDDLLVPVAHALVVQQNKVEGFATHPLPEPSEEEKAKKLAAREAVRIKREAARRKLEERLKQKEAEEAEKEKEAQQLRALLGSLDGELVEEEADPSSSSLQYVHYPSTVPLNDLHLFQKALYVWSMITSLPQSLQLSKMTFQLFVTGIEENNESDNGLMEEVCLRLLEVAVEQFKVSSPSSRFSTRGKTWFPALVDFVAQASGHKKKNVKAAPPPSESSEDDNASPSDEDEEGTEGVTVKEEEPTAPVHTFEDEIAETMGRVNEMGTRASWGNCSLEDRLNLLQFCVLEFLLSAKACEEADAIQRDADESTVGTEKALREIREDTERALKKVWKSTGDSDTNMQAEEAGKLIAAALKKRNALYASWIQRQDDLKTGGIIQPLGTDRFRRLYWRFPLDHSIYVQSTESTVPHFPILPSPPHFTLSPINQKRMLLDDEPSAESSPVRSEASEPTQTTWGLIPAHYLEIFVKGLELTGKKEGALRLALESMAPTLRSNALSSVTFVRTTRSRHHMLGYTNELKPFSY